MDTRTCGLAVLESWNPIQRTDVGYEDPQMVVGGE